MLKKLLFICSIFIFNGNGLFAMNKNTKPQKQQFSAAYESAIANIEWRDSVWRNSMKKDLQKMFNIIDADPEVRQIVAQGIKDFDIQKTVFVFKSEDEKLFEKHDRSQAFVLQASHNNIKFSVIIYFPWTRIVTHTIKQPKPRFMFNDELAQPQCEAANTETKKVKENNHPQEWKYTFYHELAHVKNEEREESNSKKIENDPVRRTATLGMYGFIGSLIASKSLTWAVMYAGLAQCLSFTLFKSWSNEASRINEAQADESATHILLQKKDYRPIIHRLLEYKFEIENRGDSISGYGTHPTMYERFFATWNIFKTSGIIWTKELYHQILEDLENDEFREEKTKGLNQIHHYFTQMQRGQDWLRVERQTYDDKKHWKQKVLNNELPGGVYAQVWWRK